MLGLIAVAVVVYFVLKGSRQGDFDVQPSSFQFDLSLATPQMWALFNAIASAENSDPSHNNPLDITPPGWTGATFGAGIAVYASRTEGVARGMYELWLIATGRSSVYSLSDTLASMAAKWTATNPDGWAAAVAESLGVTVDTPLGSILSFQYAATVVLCGGFA